MPKKKNLIKKWAEDLNRYFSKEHKDSQQAHEKMLNIVNYQRNTNQNHNEIPPHICKSSYHQKDPKNQMLARTWRRAPLYTVGGNVNWCSHYGKQYEGS